MIAQEQAANTLKNVANEDIIESLGVITKTTDIKPANKKDENSSLQASSQVVLSWDEFLASNVSKEVKEKIKKELFGEFSNHYLDLHHVAHAKVQVINITKEQEVINLKQKVATHHHTILIIPSNTTTSIHLISDSQQEEFASCGLTVLGLENTTIDFFHEVNAQSGTLLCKTQVILQANAQANWFSLHSGQRIMGGARFLLEGEQANLIATTLVPKNSNQQHDTYALVEHKAPRTHSDLLCTGLLDHSRILTKSLVKIHANAPQSRGYEKTKFLLLDKESRAISIPDLEIHNDDVQCSHGATISKIDEEELFYVQSRGVPKSIARDMIIEGFVSATKQRMPQQFQVVVDEDV